MLQAELLDGAPFFLPLLELTSNKKTEKTDPLSNCSHKLMAPHTFCLAQFPECYITSRATFLPERFFAGSEVSAKQLWEQRTSSGAVSRQGLSRVWGYACSGATAEHLGGKDGVCCPGQGRIEGKATKV